MTNFTNTVQRLLDETPDYPSFITAASHAVDQLKPNMRPQIEGRFSLTASHLVMTQLGAQPRSYVDELVRQKYRKPLSGETTGPDGELELSMKGLAFIMQKAHLLQLYQLAEPAGVVHLADTFLQAKHPSPASHDDFAYIIIPELVEGIGLFFSELAPSDQWFWRGQDPRMYLVISRMLAPIAGINVDDIINP